MDNVLLGKQTSTSLFSRTAGTMCGSPQSCTQVASVHDPLIGKASGIQDGNSVATAAVEDAHTLTAQI